MKWVPDRTGRFSKRPHYDPAELNLECEHLVLEFLKRRHRSVVYPISTDDLTVLLEEYSADLDLYADLSVDGDDVEGVTDFYPGQKPRVRISNRLSTDPRLENRLRTTLTHELTHVCFHRFMFDVERSGSLFNSSAQQVNKCKRDSIIGARVSDWMEWQAGFGCGAYLMPVSALSQLARDLLGDKSTAQVNSVVGARLIDVVAQRFSVSRDAARVRLLQQRVLTDANVSEALF
jgi:hypothetical protein